MHKSEEFGSQLISGLLTVDGLLLALAWALFDWQMPQTSKDAILPMLRIGSLCILASLVFGVLTFQFMVGEAKNKQPEANVFSATRVSASFLGCWLGFVLGLTFFVVALWKI